MGIHIGWLISGSRLAAGFLLASFTVGAVGSAGASDYLALKARLYDHDYGDFGGEFSATSVIGCSHDVNRDLPGLVQDTLIFDPAKGKKYPRRGGVDDCSSQLEKWFDPSESQETACGNLFLRNVGDTSRPVWTIDEPDFFAVDGLSAQKNYSAGGISRENDYAYCMEINAAMEYKGGETLQFRGDDDLWVYLDNRLAFDHGGIHYAHSETIAVDTLPFLKGKLGRTLDLDVYYCSRQPGNAVFGMQAAATLKPLAPKSLRITDTAGRALGAQEILVGKSRLCARVAYQVPGEEQCGNYREPPDLSFLSADWDLNGVPLSIVGGQACLDLDPAAFPNDTRISLTARAGSLISRIAVTLVRAARPVAGLITGDGRAEGVELRLDSAAGRAPDGVRVEFAFEGRRRTAWAKPEAGQPWLLRGPLEAGDYGSFGVTAFQPVPALARQDLYNEISERSVELGDGIGPVLSAAWLRWGNMRGQPAYLDVQVAEALAGGGDSLGRGLTWLRAPGLPDPAAVGGQGEVAGENRYYLPLPESLARSLRDGDSVSLSHAASDRNGNGAGIHFLPVLFPRNLEATVGGLRFPVNPARGAAFIPADGRGILIPVDAAGKALTGDAGLAAMAESRGPVLVFPTLVPVARIRLGFHDHLGGFVNTVDRTFSDAEWDAIRAASPGDTAWVRLLWYPVSHSGGRLATGAYVAQGRIWTREGLVSGPDGYKVKVAPADHGVPPRLFGYLRD